MGSEAPGSVVWLSHAGRIVRCSPEQLRRVTGDLTRLDLEINGERTFSKMFELIRQQQRYLDATISSETTQVLMRNNQGSVCAESDRLYRSRRPKTQQNHLTSQAVAAMDRDALRKLGEEFMATNRQKEEKEKQQALLDLRKLTPEEVDQFTVTAGKYKNKAFHELYADHDYIRWAVEQSGCPRDAAGHGPLGDEDDRRKAEGAVGQEGHREDKCQLKRRISLRSEREEEDRRDERKPVMPGQRDGRGGTGTVGPPGPHGSSGDRPSSSANRGDSPRQQSHGADRECARDTHRRDSEADELRSRSRSPKGDKKPAESGHVRMRTEEQSSMPCFFSSVGKLSVLELEVPIAPRDVHKSKGVWVVNQKAKKNIEVTMCKLCATEQKEFEQAMRVETDSFMSTEAVRICERAGIPKERNAFCACVEDHYQ